MKKKLMSLLMAMVLILGVASPSFAAGMPGGEEVEPFNNRYYYVTEYSSPDYEVSSTKEYTVEDYEMALAQEALQGVIVEGLAVLFPRAADDVVIATQTLKVIGKLKELHALVGATMDKDDKFFTVTTYHRYKYKYRVDRLDESNRHLESTTIYIKMVTAYANGEKDEVTRSFPMK